jgi:hypothetical protein
LTGIPNTFRSKQGAEIPIKTKKPRRHRARFFEIHSSFI